MLTWETATIDDLFPVRCAKCGTVGRYTAWMDAFTASTGREDGICCPECSSEDGKILGDFYDQELYQQS